MDKESIRAIGYQVADLIAEYCGGPEDRPLFSGSKPDQVEEAIDRLMELDPESPSEIIKAFEQEFLPHTMNVTHPGYFGLMTVSPSVMAVFADALASALNQNVGAWRIGPPATHLERRMVRWLCNLVGYEEGSGGNFTSGGTEANMIGAKFARDNVNWEKMVHVGLQSSEVPQGLVAYASEERHVSVDKAFDLVGVGRKSLRIIPTDNAYRIRLDLLEKQIEQDKNGGLTPFCLIGIAGTTVTGAIDPIKPLAELAKQHNMWLHVDAAYGGGACLSTKRRHLVEELAYADSITFDPHKWLFLPIDIGAILVKDQQALTKSFGIQPEYLKERADPQGRYDFYVHGFQQTRRFRSLKLWMALKYWGEENYRKAIDRTIDLAEYMKRLVDTVPNLHALCEPTLALLAVRYYPEHVEQAIQESSPEEIERLESTLQEIHSRVQQEIEQSGKAWISTTRLKGHAAFRINIMNFHTRRHHIDELIELITRYADRWAERLAL